MITIICVRFQWWRCLSCSIWRVCAMRSWRSVERRGGGSWLRRRSLSRVRGGPLEQNKPGNRRCRSAEYFMFVWLWRTLSNKWIKLVTGLNASQFEMFSVVHRVLDWAPLMEQKTLQVQTFVKIMSCLSLCVQQNTWQTILMDRHPEASPLQSVLWDEVVVCIVLGSHQIWEITIQSTVFPMVCHTSCTSPSAASDSFLTCKWGLSDILPHIYLSSLEYNTVCCVYCK